MFWNRSLDHELLLGSGATPTDAFATKKATVSSGGRLLVGGRPIRGAILFQSFAVTPVFRNARPVERYSSFSLWRAVGGPRLRALETGRFGDGSLAGSGELDVWPKAGTPPRADGSPSRSGSPASHQGSVTIHRGSVAFIGSPRASNGARRSASAAPIKRGSCRSASSPVWRCSTGGSSAHIRRCPSSPQHVTDLSPSIEVLATLTETADIQRAMMALSIDDLVREMKELDASDLHLTAESKPVVRVRGVLEPLENHEILSNEDTRDLLYRILSTEQQKVLETKRHIDIAYSIPGVGRLRVNVFFQRAALGAAFRMIPTEIRSLGELGLPHHIQALAEKPRGLVLVTGPTGSVQVEHAARLPDRPHPQARRAHETHPDDRGPDRVPTPPTGGASAIERTRSALRHAVVRRSAESRSPPGLPGRDPRGRRDAPRPRDDLDGADRGRDTGHLVFADAAYHPERPNDASTA